MISLFKTKPKLFELTQNGYTDIHNHLLPGIDDGAKSIKDTQTILESMKSFGFTSVIATPHTMNSIWSNTPESITNSLTHTKTELTEISNSLQLRAASEYFLDENFVNLVSNKNLLTLKDNYLLVEMSYLNAPIQLFDYLFELQVQGYIPVLAHPERYTFYHQDKKMYDKLKKAGCYFQLNLLATTGYYGKHVADVANYLLENNYYDFSGSDIHHGNHLNSFKNKVVIKSSKKLEALLPENDFFK